MRANTPAQIYVAAIWVFQKKRVYFAFQNVTIDVLMKNTGLSRSGLCTHLNSKAALPLDIARVNPDVQACFMKLFTAIVGLFENSLAGQKRAREKVLFLAALCVGGSVSARSLPDFDLAEEVRVAARHAAKEIAVILVS